MPVNDEDGLRYRDEVIEQLSKLRPKVVIKVLDTSMLEADQSINDVLDHAKESGRDRLSITHGVDQLLAQAERLNSDKGIDRICAS